MMYVAPDPWHRAESLPRPSRHVLPAEARRCSGQPVPSRLMDKPDPPEDPHPPAHVDLPGVGHRCPRMLGRLAIRLAYSRSGVVGEAKVCQCCAEGLAEQALVE